MIPSIEEIPKINEIGVTSAPLKAASYFIGAYCKPFNEDFMLCKTENKEKGEATCLKEGRRVTRCSIDLLENLHKYCADTFKKYWKCLDNNNQEFRSCRIQEREFNKCVFNNLKLEKIIPGAPQNEEPIFMKKNPIF
ncbi:hypothetical protein PCANB_003038 [Pneumocystis canis]|nr:hypothetical protein PCK1_003121 [Pneumocystis canis]KAG5438187.1 hypothetical protein PCANB_003038 [Pneumocystis canis]